MGWSFMPMPSDGAKVYLDRQFSWNNDGTVNRVIDSAIVNRSEYYCALETIKPDGARYIWAGVCLLKFCPKARDGCTFGYKDMDENCGPYAHNCPARILDLLTEEGAREYGLQWRARCRELIAARKAKPALIDGITIEIENAPTFRGVKLDRVQVIKEGRRLFFKHAELFGCFRWPSIRKHNYKLAAN